MTEGRKFQLCETRSAYKWHIRQLRPMESPAFSGHKSPNPFTLCGLQAGWDIKAQLREDLLTDVCPKCTNLYRGETR